MNLITWVKPNGNEIKTNDEKATIVYAESLGWKRKDKKRGRPPKES
jgi:hypothetical protein